jgi:hypothetical protein
MNSSCDSDGVPTDGTGDRDGVTAGVLTSCRSANGSETGSSSSFTSLVPGEFTKSNPRSSCVNRFSYGKVQNSDIKKKKSATATENAEKIDSHETLQQRRSQVPNDLAVIWQQTRIRWKILGFS